MEIPICNNCKYKSSLLSVATCNRPSGNISFVSGIEDKQYTSCSVERRHETYLDKVRCGPSGKFFVPSNWFKVKEKVKSLFN